MSVVRFLALMFLAACGSGGSGSSAAPPPIADLAAQIEAPGVTAIADVPNMGSQLFAGEMEIIMPLRDVPAAPYRGDMTMEVSFADTQMTLGGQAGGFTGTDGTQLDGTLDLSAAKFFPTAQPTDFQFEGELDGELTHDGVTYAVGSDFSADFYSRDGSGMSGKLDRGLIREKDDTHYLTVAQLQGAFVATKVDQ